MVIGFLILVGGFALFTTTLVAIGAVMPTAKEAGNFMGVMMALIFVPFYAVALVVSDPHAVIVQIFTYFPFSAPVTALLRNGFGSLSVPEAAIVIVILYAGAAVMLRAGRAAVPVRFHLLHVQGQHPHRAPGGSRGTLRQPEESGVTGPTPAYSPNPA